MTISTKVTGLTQETELVFTVTHWLLLTPGQEQTLLSAQMSRQSHLG